MSEYLFDNIKRNRLYDLSIRGETVQVFPRPNYPGNDVNDIENGYIHFEGRHSQKHLGFCTLEYFAENAKEVIFNT